MAGPSGVLALVCQRWDFILLHLPVRLSPSTHTSFHSPCSHRHPWKILLHPRPCAHSIFEAFFLLSLIIEPLKSTLFPPKHNIHLSRYLLIEELPHFLGPFLLGDSVLCKLWWEAGSSPHNLGCNFSDPAALGFLTQVSCLLSILEVTL